MTRADRKAQRLAHEWKPSANAPVKLPTEVQERTRETYGGRWRASINLSVSLCGPLFLAPLLRVQSRLDPQHTLDATADLFPFRRAEPLDQLVGVLATTELVSDVAQVPNDLLSRRPLHRR